jgi:hypothetical protein
MKINNWKNFNESKSYSELSESDRLKVDMIDRKVHSILSGYENTIKEYKKYLSDYKLSDDLKEFLENEVKYFEERKLEFSKMKRNRIKDRKKDN